MTVEALLKKRIGLNPDSIGRKKFHADIRRCMLAAGAEDENAYLLLLQASAFELEKLIETITVPETWFFRSRGAFDCLKDHARKIWGTGKKEVPMRILSVPCATGEEAYSIAMTLFDAGLLPGQFHIDATDISKKGIRDAEHAVYGENAFRGKHISFRARYFTETDQGYRLRRKAKETVTFICDNILAPFFLSGRNPYDVIFCRNLLIYFDPPAQQEVIRILDRLLKKNGLLFVGYAETGLFTDKTWLPVQKSGGFAFFKSTGRTADPAGKPDNRRGIPSMVTGLKPDVRKNPPQPVSAGAPNPAADRSRRAPVTPPNTPMMKDARALADAGRLFEAAELCETRLKADRMDTEAYCLLGVIRLALDDNAAAEQYFNKAVKLDPNHYETLVHLALLSEHRGEKESAIKFQQRAESVGRSHDGDGVGQQP